MRLLKLDLKDIGPFNEGHLNFTNEDGDYSPVTIITGENGTGKTIILDAIRTLLMGNIKTRDIFRNDENSAISCKIQIGNDLVNDSIKKHLKRKVYPQLESISLDMKSLGSKFVSINEGGDTWIANYWTSQTKNDAFAISSLVSIKPEDYLRNALDGIQSNVEVTALITYFDYLKTSDNPKEKQEGEFLFNILKDIIKLSLNGGEFLYVERKTLTPIVNQLGNEVAINQLSSGNLYLIQRLISLLGQMYSVYILNPEIALVDLCKTPGLLLIDEAENHLHPKWQKTFLNTILEIFPNLQIIASTHSPFIVSSVENAKVFVCKSMINNSIIVDETAQYSNKPIEEVLLSDVFNTERFNQEITDLLEERNKAIQSKDYDKKTKIEAQLKSINPTSFSYFDIEKMMQELVEK
ncbi:MAG TPA: AAA family ATPase [Saprospiraceae bacterium]|nr:AAA family ATPase [Saprospiraceae bacterium]MBK9584101.1 AAA family ATPase [Saprospiraceae bacterium]HRG41180.1 AAA family ATPase [Saprospiraceae bacterium]